MSDGARVLLWDTETAPNLAYVWGRYQQDVIRYESEFYLLTMAWKWLGDKKVQTLGLDDFPLYAKDPENDLELVNKAHQLFSEADVVIAHNGIAFDTRKVQARMLVHGFAPPTPFKEVDTLRIAKRHFSFNSNRLDDLCRVLGIGQKLETGGFDTWLGCMKGDPSSWAKMKRYNKHDVEILEQLYFRLRPWTDKHPNLSAIANKSDICPKCSSDAGMVSRGYRCNSVTRRRLFQCKGCGGYVTGREIEKLETRYVA